MEYNGYVILITWLKGAYIEFSVKWQGGGENSLINFI